MIVNKKMSVMPRPNRNKYLLSNFLGYDESKISNALPRDFSDECYNFAFYNNMLAAKNGITPLEITAFDKSSVAEIVKTPFIEGEVHLFLARNNKKVSNFVTIVLSHKGGIESIELSPGAAWAHCVCENIATNSISYLHEDKDLLLLSSSGKKGIMVFENNEVTTIANALAVVDLCAHAERIFAVVEEKRNSLWFSDDFDPFNWNVSISEGGYINFDGTLGGVNAIKSFRDYLYVFCDYGIYRLSAFSDQTQFSLKKLYCACGQIYPKSIVDCGDKLAFVSSDGIYFFDGSNVSRYNVETRKLFESGFDSVSGAYCNHKYYISINNKHNDSFDFAKSDMLNNTLVVCDTLKMNININKGMFLDELQTLFTPTQNVVIALCKDSEQIVKIDESGHYLDKKLVRMWKIKNIDFGNHMAQKLVRGVEYSTECEYTFGVVTDGKYTQVVLSPKEKYASLNIRGNTFDFYIQCDNDGVEISSPIVVVDFLK